MSAVVWSTGAVDGGLGWVGGEDVVEIDEYELMLEGALPVFHVDILFVVDRLRLRQIYAAL